LVYIRFAYSILKVANALGRLRWYCPADFETDGFTFAFINGNSSAETALYFVKSGVSLSVLLTLVLAG
jgi:hypothetical protein